MYSILFLSCFTVQAITSSGLNIPKCNSSDNSCITKAAKVAYPQIVEADPSNGAEQLDPLFSTVIEGKLSILKYSLYNTTSIGVKTCEVSSAKYDEGKRSLLVVLDCPRLIMKGWYDIDGQLIILPIKGNGDYSISAKRYKIAATMELKDIERDGKHYKQIKNFKVEPDALEPIIYVFNNLFNGQKDLANAVLHFANENWKEVSIEVQGPVFTEIFKRIIKNANKYLKTIPFEN